MPIQQQIFKHIKLSNLSLMELYIQDKLTFIMHNTIAIKNNLGSNLI